MQSASRGDKTFLAFIQVLGGVHVMRLPATSPTQAIELLAETYSRRHPKDPVAVPHDDPPSPLTGRTAAWCWTSLTQREEHFLLVTLVRRNRPHSYLTHVSFPAGGTSVEQTPEGGADAALRLVQEQVAKEAHGSSGALKAVQPQVVLQWSEQYATWYYCTLVNGAAQTGFVFAC